MKLNPSSVVYIAGLVPFGLFYESIKRAVPNGLLFVALAIGYVVLLRLVGDAITRRLDSRRRVADEE